MEERAVAERPITPLERELGDQKEALAQLELAVISLEERLAPISRGDVPELGGGEPSKMEVHGSGQVYGQVHNTTVRVFDLVRRVRKITNTLEV